MLNWLLVSGQVMLNLNQTFNIFFFFFFSLHLEKLFYSEIFYGSASVKGNTQGSQNHVSRAAMENVSNRVLHRPTGWGLEEK